MPLFVWVLGMRGPEPQIIKLEQVNGQGENKLNVLQKHKISENMAGLPIDDLIKTFPYGDVSDE